MLVNPRQTEAVSDVNGPKTSRDHQTFVTGTGYPVTIVPFRGN